MLKHPPYLVPVLAALTASLITAGEAPPPGGTPAPGGLTPDQEKFWDESQRGAGAVSKDQVAAEAKVVEAKAYYASGRFIDARESVEAALRLYPPHTGAQALREQILGTLSLRDNTLQMVTKWLGDVQDVRTQETAVRMAALLESAQKKMSAGDFEGAELEYDRVEVAVRTFPYQFDWGTLPQEVQTRKFEARAQARSVALERQKGDRDQGLALAEERRRLAEEALHQKVDEMLRRAKVAFGRKDYKRAEIDAWNAYELDRRRDDARELYLAARRKGHEQFDVEWREEKLERVARVHEEIHKSLIPQTELLVYPEDWARRALRTPREIAGNKEEPWMAAIRDRLQQQVTFDFEDTAFEDVINFFRQVTGISIIVAPEVGAAGAGTVTLRARDMRFSDALKWVLELTKLHSAILNQAIYVSNKPVAGAVALRLYDIADLISPVRDFPGPELAFNAGGKGGKGGGGFDLFGGAGAGKGGGATALDPAQLVEFIKKSVEPTSWTKEGVAIDQRSGATLFVNQAPEVHTLIEQLLQNLRNTHALQVNIGVRVVDVRKGFFEEIGVEFFNNGINPGLLNNAGAVGAVGNAGFGGGGTNGLGYVNNTTAVDGFGRHVLPANATFAQFTGDADVDGIYDRGLHLELSRSPFAFLNQFQINGVLAAVEEETDFHNLQHPVITCFNGQRAHAAFIVQYAYISGYGGNGGTLDPTIEVLAFGDIIDVRPVVSSDRKYVTMEIRPSSVLFLGSTIENVIGIIDLGDAGNGVNIFALVNNPIELPSIDVRTLRSTVMLPDKGNLLLGGFNESLRQRVHSGIPFLSHIPFLGRLFSRNGTYDENRRLFFLLNAEIIDLAERESLR